MLTKIEKIKFTEKTLITHTKYNRTKKKQWKGELQLHFARQLNILFPINSKKKLILLIKKNKLKS